MTGADALATIAKKQLRFGDADLIEALRVVAIVEELRQRAGNSPGADCCPGCQKSFSTMSPRELELHQRFTKVQLKTFHGPLVPGRKAGA